MENKNNIFVHKYFYMKSKISEALKINNSPVAVILTNEKPEVGIQFKESTWGCVASMMSAVSTGKTAYFDQSTFGCIGGGTGLGFGNQYGEFPIEKFLADGFEDFESESGKNIAGREGENYCKASDIAKAFVDNLPMRDITYDYVVLKPLEIVSEMENVSQVIYFVNADRLSALVVLANFGREDSNSVIAPFCAACQSILYGYNENEKVFPRAIIGFFDISARKYVDNNTLTFTMPYKMFLEMESNVDESFLKNDLWKKLLERNK